MVPVKTLDENKLKIVDSSEVPSGRMETSKWQSIFGKIPVGKALVLTEDEISFVAVRSSLYELQRKGQFKNLIARKVKGTDGKYRMYVINVAKKETTV
jgi:hypothetical protein